MGMIDDTFFSEHSAQKGSVIHKAIEYELRGTLAIATLHPDLVPYLESFRLWRGSVRLEVLALEMELKDESIGLIGHLDIFCKLNGFPSIIDIKSGVPMEWHRLQLSLYKHLLHANQKIVMYRHSLHVHRTGSRATLITHSDRNDDAYAMHLIGAYNARKIYGPKEIECQLK